MQVVFPLLAGLIIGAALALGFGSLALALIDSRRQLKVAQKALEARETPSELEEPFTYPPYVHPAPTAPPLPNEFDRFPGVGPTAIANRELYERSQKVDDTRPKFANPSVLNPSLNDIGEAAREATNGGKPN